MAQALYRKYRSKSLDEIVGQQHITSLLTKALEQGRIAHAYLLTGPRGVGKTSVARILAHAINKLPYTGDGEHLDIIEIDAASNNGVEDVRDLREKARIAPVSAAKKVYIIDEVHMLSKPAFNALLKTLEEPPEHVVFILATTDVEKLPATIISRTQRFSFRAIGREDAVKHLRKIADDEKIKIDDAALAIIAERGDGSFRDSISLLDQLSSLADDKTGITAELVEATLGLAPTKLVEGLLAAVEAHDVATIAKLLQQAGEDGISSTTIANQLTSYLEQMVAEKPQLLDLLDHLLDVSKSNRPQLKLLSVLGMAAAPKSAPKTAALATPVLEVSASVEELARQATRERPVERPVEKPAKKPAGEAKPFDWEALIEYTRKEYVPVYSVLSKCKYELDGKDLTIYTGNAFYKKKLDDPKYSPMIYSSLEAIGSFELTVHTIPTTPAPKDSQAAAVAAIMGGGVEVSLEAL
jgi:DNA polymerase-3 subunit gamma/tau